ncbi:FAD-dependent oxidoreductase [Nocardia fusca]|uniref:FAD-dependent oxidoreductase n=1 Tax=Nocardia fusca TaxID=941183 RepID=UPI000B0083F2|nr:FAD-dependent oxidoreductase [Nocardia fusca]
MGHICTTPQTGRALDYAWSAREKWLRLAEQAGFEISRADTVVVARTAAELGVLEEFAAERGTGEVRLLDRAGTARLFPPAGDPGSDILGGAHLALDLRVDPRAAIPALAARPASRGVEFVWNTQVGAVSEGAVHTARGDLAATAIVHAAGHDIDRLFPVIAEEHGVRRCRLQMMEVAPPGDIRIEPAILTGYSMLRYGGLGATASAAVVRREITDRAPETLDAVMNLMLTSAPTVRWSSATPITTPAPICPSTKKTSRIWCCAKAPGSSRPVSCRCGGGGAGSTRIRRRPISSWPRPQPVSASSR